MADTLSQRLIAVPLGPLAWLTRPPGLLHVLLQAPEAASHQRVLLPKPLLERAAERGHRVRKETRHMFLFVGILPCLRFASAAVIGNYQRGVDSPDSWQVLCKHIRDVVDGLAQLQQRAGRASRAE
jgi:hypothetical protein